MTKALKSTGQGAVERCIDGHPHSDKAQDPVQSVKQCLSDRVAPEGSCSDMAMMPEDRPIFRNDPTEKPSFARYLEDLSRWAFAAPADYDQITLTSRATIPQIASILSRWGIVVLPGLITGPALSRLNREFDEILSEAPALDFPVVESAESLLVRAVTKRLDPTRYGATHALFKSSLLQSILEAFLRTERFTFNNTLYVHRTSATDNPPSGELHFDVTRMLKCWLYLEEATVENGAMRAVPGSQIWIRALREEFSARLIAKSKIHNEIDERAHPAIPICGPAGTLFIFDTDVAHGAGAVASGHHRRIIRGHSVEDYLQSRNRARSL